jgi:oligopeptide/dipeptide ABC transporter ATP-binding protein
MERLIDAAGVVRHFPAARRLRDVLRGERRMVRALDGVDLAVAPGETVGLVGESGSGKTTLGRLMLRLDRPDLGAIRFEGTDIGPLRGTALRQFRARAQFVFQNPYDALNPRLRIGQAIAEPLGHLGVPKAEHEARVAEAIGLVRLDGIASLREAYPHQLSGGQLQRVVLARALVPRPRFLVADEPVSMLDVSVRAGVLNLFRELCGRLGIASLTISHDMALVRHVCARTVVLYRGLVVEEGPTDAIIRTPAHPYTQALIAAVPRPHVNQPRAPLPLVAAAEAVDPGHAGCRLAPRCPHAFARCREAAPVLRTVGPGHRAACHLHEETTA